MSGERIVVIDDDEMVARLYRHLLRAQGYDVDVATDGQSGMNLVQRLPPDLVLLDLGLPDLPGAEVLRRLRARSPALPIVVLSATESGEPIQTAQAAGATAILSKIGATPKRVVAAIAEALR